MGQRDAARQFANDWSGRGNEDAHSQSFWLDLLRDVFGVEKSSSFIEFEKPVSFGGYTHKIDGYISKTKVLIEQKNYRKNLSDKYQQSDGIFLTPFDQALRYAENLDYGERPRWIVTCNFTEFRIYYAQKFFFYYETLPPVIVKLENLPDEYNRLKFLVDPDDTTILDDVNFSKTALSIIKKVYFGFAARYLKSPVDGWREYLYKICVRLVFCFFADDSHLFNENSDEKFFANYLQNLDGENQINALQNIFDVLNTDIALRGNIDAELNKFPYVNGKLFEEKVIFPDFSDHRTTPINYAFLENQKNTTNSNFHWEKISPSIFGALFESFLNMEEVIEPEHDIRRQGGMHYTSEENIHKVIYPLFFNKLRKKLDSLKHPNTKNRLQKLIDFQNDLASLTFLDPACGSGNFLTETYKSIRGLENEAIREMDKLDSNLFNRTHPIKVTIENFFGIEIHDYAVAVAKVAMWIVELQMLRQTENILHKNLNPLPLKKYPNIICANALQIDWSTVVSRDKLSFIIGNPPFVGKSYQTLEQKADMKKIFEGVKGYGNLDYVTSWYKKAIDFIKGTKIECSFVSTNSICQGIAVPPLWNFIFNAGVKINFAYRTFKWTSESANMAAVHCVIIGFAMKSRRKKFIYDGDKIFYVQNINAYLLDAPNIIVKDRPKPICDVPPMIVGSCPTDGGGFIIEWDEYDDFIKCEPAAQKFIRPYIGSEEFINGKKRYCLWLKDCSPEELNKMPLVTKRVECVKNFRLASKKKQTRIRAQTPTLFAEDRYVDAPAIFIPMLSSSNRKYIPIGFVSSKVITSNLASFIPNATIYDLGILTSTICMAWMKIIGSRFKTDYRFSASLVYNNFVWCSPTDAQKELIEQTAQKILDVRAEFADKTLAYLYNEATMPPELRLAHMENDAAVMAAYGFDENFSELEIVAELMKMYKNLTGE